MNELDERIRATQAVIKKSERALEELRTRPWQHATSLVCTDSAFEELEERTALELETDRSLAQARSALAELMGAEAAGE
jgi:hypothetical protein